VWTLAAFVGLTLVTAPLALTQPYSHDEHQFVASGGVLALQGWLPYRDYPYFHMPNLVLLYGLLFKLTDWHLLSARLVSAASASGTIVLLAQTALRVVPGARRQRWLVAAAAVLFVIWNPLFIYTSGLAWNHDAGVLCSVAAVLLLIRGLVPVPRHGLVLASGVLLSLAIGTRLSFAPLGVPMLVGALLAPGVARAPRGRLAVIFLAGVLIGALPSLVLFGLAPEQFVFGNLGYAAINTLYWQHSGYVAPLSLLAKVRYVASEVADTPGTLMLGVVFGVFAVLLLRRRPRALTEPSLGIWLLMGSLPCLLIGSLAPTPALYQYFYALIPFLVLGLIYGLTSVEWSSDAGQIARPFVAIALLVCAVYAAPAYARRVWPPAAWAPLAEHALGVEIARATDAGPILTLAPLIPLEGDRSVYPALVTGPFAWRTAPELDARRRRAVNMPIWPDLIDRAGPPVGILVGFEGQLEEPFIAYAQDHGYREMKLAGGASLWVRP